MAPFVLLVSLKRYLPMTSKTSVYEEALAHPPPATQHDKLGRPARRLFKPGRLNFTVDQSAHHFT